MHLLSKSQIVDAALTNELKKWIAQHVLGWNHIANASQGHGHYYWKDRLSRRYDLLPNFWEDGHWWQVFTAAFSEVGSGTINLVKSPHTNCDEQLTYRAEVHIGDWSYTGTAGIAVCRTALLAVLSKKGLLFDDSPQKSAVVADLVGAMDSHIATLEKNGPKYDDN